jgi:tetratricopeptide (TPR) repeat protein
MRLALLLLTLAAFTAHAESAQVKKYLNAAITLYENLEYEKALKQLARAKPKADGPDDETRIALLEGIVLADMGKKEQALTAFKTGFGLNLEAKLPVEVSPKVSAIAEEARGNVRTMLAPRLEAERLEAEKRTAEDAARAEEARKEEAARLAEQKRLEEEERQKLQPPPAVVKPAPAPGVRRLAWVPLAVGVASAGVATGLLLDASSKHRALVEGTAAPEQAAAMRDAGKMEATVAYVGLGVAGAAVAAAAGMYFFGGDAPAVAVVPSPQGAFVSVAVPFDFGK